MKDRIFYKLDVTLCIILLAAIALRIAALLNYQNSIYNGFLIWDESVYQNWALKILEGSSPTNFAHDFAPLPAYLMALLYKVISPNPLVFRIFNILISTITCLLFYGIGKTLANRTVGLIACFFSALYGPFIFFSFTLLKTSLAVFLFSTAVYFFLLNLKNASKLRTLGIGVAIGLLLNVRPNVIFVLVFLPLALIWYWRWKFPRFKNIVSILLLFFLGLGISVGPFMVMKYKTTGEISLTATGGFNLYLANNLQNPYPYYRPVPFAVSTPSKQATQFIIEASRVTGEKLTPGEASDYFAREVFKSASEEPFLFAKKLFLKCLALFNRYESADNYHVGFMSNYIRLFKFPFPAYWAILPLGMIGFAATIKNSVKSRAMAGIFLMYGVTLIIFFTNVRIRMPLLVILIPMAALGLQFLLSYIRERRFKQIIMLSGVGIVFALVSFIPIPGTDDMSAHYNTHAINLKQKGKIREAVSFWEESSGMNKLYSAYANLSLAKYYLNRGKVDTALEYAVKIPSSSFVAAPKYEMIGDIHRRRRSNDKAIEAYVTSLSINSALMSPRLKLINLYKITDPKKVKKVRDKLKYIYSFSQGT